MDGFSWGHSISHSLLSTSTPPPPARPPPQPQKKKVVVLKMVASPTTTTHFLVQLEVRTPSHVAMAPESRVPGRSNSSEPPQFLVRVNVGVGLSLKKT